MTHRGMTDTLPYIDGNVIQLHRVKKSDGQSISDGYIFVPVKSVVYIEYAEVAE